MKTVRAASYASSVGEMTRPLTKSRTPGIEIVECEGETSAMPKLLSVAFGAATGAKAPESFGRSGRRRRSVALSPE
jgi:hypothetical protein